VFTDECRQNLNHGRVISGRVPRNSLQGVDAANAYIKLVRAELLDRLAIQVGDLPVTCGLQRGLNVEASSFDD
jgi:hypothetical protein